VEGFYASESNTLKDIVHCMPNTYSKGQYRTTGRNGGTGQKEGIRLKEIKTKCIEGMQRKQEPKKKATWLQGKILNIHQ